jgi:hypothetical protein
MPKVTQLTVCLENKRGQAAKLGAALKRAKVNILALSVADSAEAGVIRLVPDSAPKATKALKSAGMAVIRTNVLGVTLPNEPGALASATKALSDAGVNIDYLYGSVAKSAEEGMVVMGVDDIDKALKVMD